MTKEQRKDLANWIENNPDVIYPVVANLTNYSYSTITLLAAEFDIHRPTGKKRS